VDGEIDVRENLARISFAIPMTKAEPPPSPGAWDPSEFDPLAWDPFAVSGGGHGLKGLGADGVLKLLGRSEDLGLDGVGQAAPPSWLSPCQIPKNQAEHHHRSGGVI